MQPCFGHSLLASDGGHGDAQSLRGFLGAESSEKPQLDHLAFAWVNSLQRVKSVIERFDIASLFRGETQNIRQGHLSSAGAPLGAVVAARVVHQNLAHQMRGDAEEVRPALPIGKALRHQPHVGLMDQGRGLQRGRRAFVAKIVLGQPAQFVVDQRREDVERMPVPAASIQEQTGDLLLLRVAGGLAHPRDRTMRRHPRATYTCLHGSNLPASGPAEEKCGQMIDSGFNLRPKD